MIKWICDFRAPSGYGRAARADLRAAIKAGYKPSVQIHQHDSTQMKIEEEHPFWAKHASDLLALRNEDPDVTIQQETPEFYRPDPTCKNVARIEWETSSIIDYNHSKNPAYNWVAQLNRMSAVWPASDFVANVLRDCGVTRPISVIPHPIDLEEFSPGERTILGGGVNAQRFTALSMWQWTRRKNPHALLTAWSRSKLGKKDDCCLLLKTYAADFNHAQTVMREIKGFRAALNIRGLKPNVFPLTAQYPDGEIAKLHRAADVHVTATRGEGFGMPVQEAAACGVPAVYTDCTALSEFAYGYPVRCHREPVYGMPHIPWYSAEQDWWSVDVLHLVERLEEAYDDWKSGKLKEVGAAAREKVASLHSDQRVGLLLREQIEALD